MGMGGCNGGTKILLIFCVFSFQGRKGFLWLDFVGSCFDLFQIENPLTKSIRNRRLLLSEANNIITTRSSQLISKTANPNNKHSVIKVYHSYLIQKEWSKITCNRSAIIKSLILLKCTIFKKLFDGF